MGLRIDAAGGSQPRSLLSGDLNTDLIGDGACDFALQLQHIRQITLESRAQRCVSVAG